MRELPQYLTQLNIGSMPQVQYSHAQAETTQKISAQLGAVAQDMQTKSAEIEKLNATTTLRTELTRMSNESGADVGVLKEKITGYKSGFLKSIKDSALAAEFEARYDMEALPYLDKATDKYNKNLDTQYETSSRSNVAAGIASLGSIAPNLLSPIPEVKKAAQESMAQVFKDIAQTATAKKSDGTFMFTPEQQVAMAGEAQKELIVTLPPEQQLEILGGAKGGFDAAMAQVFKNEGGYSATDGNTNDPVNFGINQKAHPDVDVKNLTQAEATKIYKREYWDKYNVGALRPDQQSIVMDGVVNHGSTFAKKLVEAAKKGATPTELLDMRQDEYERLAKADPKKYASNLPGWSKRLAGFEHLTLGEHLNYLTPTAREAVKKNAIEAIQKDTTLRIADPAKYGAMRGLNTDQVVAMQPNPRTASVIDKDNAKLIAEQVKKADSPAFLIETGQKLVGQYGQYAPNAIKDLKAAGLTDEHESAILLSMKNPAYHGHVESLFGVAQMPPADLNAAVTLTGKKPADISAEVYDRFADVGLDQIYANGVETNEKPSYVQRKRNIVEGLTKAYLIKNPSADVDDAIDWAMQPETDSYSIGELNGVKYHVPKTYNVDDVELRLEMFYGNYARKNPSKEKGYSLLNGSVTPVLNDKEDGYFFLDPVGNLVYEGKNKPLTVKLDDLMQVRTMKEVRDALDKLPYGEREKARKEMFE